MVKRLITPTREDYLRAIYLLFIQEKSAVRVKDISKYLDLSKSTVSERLTDLSARKFIRFEKYSDVELTDLGLEIARKLTHKHRLIEVFLYKMLKFPKTEIHTEANRMEHAFSDKAIRKLAKLLHYPRKDPHGESIE